MEQVSVVPSSQFPGEIKWKVLRWWQCSFPPSSLWKMKAWPNLKQNVKAGMSGWFLTWFVDDQLVITELLLSSTELLLREVLAPTGLRTCFICPLFIFFHWAENMGHLSAYYFLSEYIWSFRKLLHITFYPICCLNDEDMMRTASCIQQHVFQNVNYYPHHFFPPPVMRRQQQVVRCTVSYYFFLSSFMLCLYAVCKTDVKNMYWKTYISFMQPKQFPLQWLPFTEQKTHFL